MIDYEEGNCGKVYFDWLKFMSCTCDCAGHMNK